MSKAKAIKKMSSAEKANISSVNKAKVNRARISRVKTYEKKVRAAVVAGDNSAARLVLSSMQSEIMKAVTKGVIKLGTASRKVARLAKLVKSMVVAS